MGRANIHEIAAGCKALADDYLSRYGTVMVVFALGIALFGLMRLAVIKEPHGPVQVAAAGLSVQEGEYSPGGMLVASRTKGTYFYPWCTGASKIAEEEREIFQSEKEALEAGFNPGRGCKGL